MAVRTLPGIGHFVPEEAPETVADAIREVFADADWGIGR
jgi:pimeloyl-ACP methyl ester carboxylesterase